MSCKMFAMSVREATIDELVERYSALLFDAYGVLSYSVGALPGAVELIDRLNRMGKPYYVLTNDASALPESRAERYHAVGLNVDAERIITSGSLLTGYFAEHALRGAKCAVLGTKDSAEYVRRAGGAIVSAADGFDVLVVGDQSGFPFVNGVDAVLSALFRIIDGGDAPLQVIHGAAKPGCRSARPRLPLVALTFSKKIFVEGAPMGVGAPVSFCTSSSGAPRIHKQKKKICSTQPSRVVPHRSTT